MATLNGKGYSNLLDSLMIEKRNNNNKKTDMWCDIKNNRMLLPVKERQPAIGLINREINVEKSSLSPSLSSHVPEQINLDVLKKELNEWNLLPLKKEKEQKEQISDYKVYKLLGKGGFAKVYYGINRKEGKKLAIKVLKKKEVNKNDSAKLRVKKEIKIQNFLKHKNILKIFTFFEDKQNIYLTLELCPYGDMLQYLKSKRPNLILEEEVRMILDQVVDALIYLHSFNILHRDLKLSNLLIYDQSTIKLSDFGLATQIQEDIGEQKTLCGTLNYISPEIIHRKPYNLQSDLWSLGCLTYTLLTGKAPFEGTNIKETIKKVSNVEYNLPEGISLEAVQLIQSLLRFEPRKRIQLKDLLMLPFFHKNRLRLNLDLLYLKDNTKEEKQSNSITDIELNNHIYNKDININNNNNNNIISIDNQNQKNYFTVNNTNNDFSNELIGYKFNTLYLPSNEKRMDGFVIELQEDGILKLTNTFEEYFITISSSGEVIKIMNQQFHQSKAYSLKDLPKKYHNYYKYASKWINLLKSKTVKFSYKEEENIFQWMLSDMDFEFEYSRSIKLNLNQRKQLVTITSIQKHNCFEKLELNLNHDMLDLPKEFHACYKLFIDFNKKAKLLNEYITSHMEHYKYSLPYKFNSHHLSKLNKNNASKDSETINNKTDTQIKSSISHEGSNAKVKYLKNVGWYIQLDQFHQRLLFMDGVQILLSDSGIQYFKEDKLIKKFDKKEFLDSEIHYRLKLFTAFIKDFS